MMWLRRFFYVLRQSRYDAELREEIETHRALRQAHLEREGRTSSDARDSSRRAIGNVLLAREDVRDVWVGSFTRLWQDLRIALRSLRRRRSFTILVATSLALGVGVNSAMFTLVDGLLLRDIPVVNPGELILLQKRLNDRVEPRFSYPAFRHFHDGSKTISGIAGVSIVSRVRTQIDGSAADVQHATVQMATGGFFDVLGVTPWIGRLIASEDDKAPGTHAVAVVSHAYWRTRLAADRGVVGRQLRLNEKPFTIIGITPPAFYGVEPGAAPDLWVPAMMQADIMEMPSLVHVPSFNWLYVFARPRSGTPRAQTVAELAVLQEQYKQTRAQTVPGESRRRAILGEQLEAIPGRAGIGRLVDVYRGPLMMLMATVAVVLLMSCLNVSMLVLARTTHRIKEIAIRAAIGARPFALLIYVGLESTVPTFVGCAAGLVAGQWVLGYASHLIPPGPGGLALAIDTAFNYRTLVFSTAVAVASAAVFTIVPAIRIARVDLVGTLSNDVGSRAGGASGHARSLRNLAIIGQVATSLVLLVCGSLFIETLRNLRAVELGFRADRAVAFAVALPRGYHVEQVHQFSLRLLDRLETLPGMESATLGSPSLLGGYESRALVAVGDGAVSNEAQRDSNFMTVSPNFFTAMRIPIIAGRAFGTEDVVTAPPVVLITESAARSFFGDENPIGQRIRARTADRPFGEPMVVIGVTRDVRFRDLRSSPGPLVYRSAVQEPVAWADGFVVHGAAGVGSLSRAIQDDMRRVDPNAVLESIETFSQRIDRWADREHVLASIATILGFLALLLACLGIYGVTAIVVAERRKEIATRVAIGSSLSGVTWLFVRQALTLAVLGCLVGTPLAVLAARRFAEYLFDVTATAPSQIGPAVLLAIAVPAVASVVAVRREARIDPAIVLKSS